MAEPTKYVYVFSWDDELPEVPKHDDCPADKMASYQKKAQDMKKVKPNLAKTETNFAKYVATAKDKKIDVSVLEKMVYDPKTPPGRIYTSSQVQDWVVYESPHVPPAYKLNQRLVYANKVIRRKLKEYGKLSDLDLDTTGTPAPADYSERFARYGLPTEKEETQREIEALRTRGAIYDKQIEEVMSKAYDEDPAGAWTVELERLRVENKKLEQHMDELYTHLGTFAVETPPPIDMDKQKSVTDLKDRLRRKEHESIDTDAEIRKLQLEIELADDDDVKSMIRTSIDVLKTKMDDLEVENAAIRVEIATTTAKDPRDDEIERLREERDNAQLLAITMQKRLDMVKKLNGNYFQTACRLFPKHRGLRQMVQQHEKMIHKSYDGECYVWPGLKIDNQMRPIISGVRKTYQDAVFHANYGLAYSAQMVAFNITAKQIIFEDWSQPDDTDWPLLETEVKKHTFLSSLETLPL